MIINYNMMPQECQPLIIVEGPDGGGQDHAC